MELNEIAKKLGYSDSENLQANIDSYGQPLQQWWDVITELVNNINYTRCCMEFKNGDCDCPPKIEGIGCYQIKDCKNKK